MQDQEPRYPYLVVDVEEALADDASVSLFELGAVGVELRDATTLAKSAGEGRVRLVASFSDRASADAALAEVDAAWSPRIEELVGDEWRDAWKQHFRPFRLTDRITVRPPWEAYTPEREGELVLDLEPGRAFGTGLHATTSLVARALDARARELAGVTVLDVGCGSGILALVALSLGAASARAIDVDEEAVLVTRENAERNGLDSRVVADATPVERIAETYPVVLANIEARVLTVLAEALKKTVRPGGLLVLSGILVGQEADVASAFAPFVLEETTVEGEWVALAVRAPRAG